MVLILFHNPTFVALYWGMCECFPLKPKPFLLWVINHVPWYFSVFPPKVTVFFSLSDHAPLVCPLLDQVIPTHIRKHEVRRYTHDYKNFGRMWGGGLDLDPLRVKICLA